MASTYTELQITTLHEIIKPQFGEKVALIESGTGATSGNADEYKPRAWTFKSLEHEIERVGKALRDSGVKPGDIVSILLPNGAPFVVTFLATTWIRAVAAPLNPLYTEEEFRYYMEDAKSVVAIVPGDFADSSSHPDDVKAREKIAKTGRGAAGKLGLPVFGVYDGLTDGIILDTGGASLGPAVNEGYAQPGDVSLFLHTSGTTSRPKGVPLTHKNLTTSIKNISRTYELTSEDKTLLVMPLFHVHGLMAGLLSTLHTGGTVIIPRGGKFSASTFWKDIKGFEVTWYTAVPTIHQILLMKAHEDFPKDSPPALRFIRSCSASLAPAVLEGLEKNFHAPVLEAYAMTEASHQMCSNPLPKYGPHKPGTVGPGQNVQVAILDNENQPVPVRKIGEVCIRGENVTSGYLNRPEANEEAFAGGWFHTGDQGFLDEEGYLTLTGRIKELINRGGEKISPLEVDAALLAIPEVGEAVSFAAPDPKYGEEVFAAVVLKPSAPSSVTEEYILSHLKDKLSAFKHPKKLFIAQDLPRTATGKIQRRFVAEHFLKG